MSADILDLVNEWEGTPDNPPGFAIVHELADEQDNGDMRIIGHDDEWIQSSVALPLEGCR